MPGPSIPADTAPTPPPAADPAAFAPAAQASAAEQVAPPPEAPQDATPAVASDSAAPAASVLSLRWIVGMQTSRDLEIVFDEPATREQAVEEYRKTCGILSTPHPITAEPLAD